MILINDIFYITGKVKALCHYYYILDTILGTSQAFHTSYQREPGSVTVDIPEDEIETLESDADENDPSESDETNDTEINNE